MSERERPERKPIKVVLEAGRYAICRCGSSTNAPHCDGSHDAEGPGPMTHEIADTERVAWCTCGASSRRPWCDGSHRDAQREQIPTSPS